jgi:hypothetical protein
MWLRIRRRELRNKREPQADEHVRRSGLLIDLLTKMADGNAVSLIPVHTELARPRFARPMRVIDDGACCFDAGFRLPERMFELSSRPRCSNHLVLMRDPNGYRMDQVNSRGERRPSEKVFRPAPAFGGAQPSGEDGGIPGLQRPRCRQRAGSLRCSWRRERNCRRCAACNAVFHPDLEQGGNTNIVGSPRPHHRRYGPRPRPPLVPSRTVPMR